jgi:hypothetical protein
MLERLINQKKIIREESIKQWQNNNRIIII